MRRAATLGSGNGFILKKSLVIDKIDVHKLTRIRSVIAHMPFVLLDERETKSLGKMLEFPYSFESTISSPSFWSAVGGSHEVWVLFNEVCVYLNRIRKQCLLHTLVSFSSKYICSELLV